MLCGKLRYGLLGIAFVFAYMSHAAAQNTSNEGRDFWVAFPRHEPSNQVLANLRLFITAKSNSRGVVQVGGTSIPFTVNAHVATYVDIPRGLAYLNDTGTFSNRGIHVLVDASQPKVVVYAHLYATDRSAATLVLPTESLGAKYYVMGYDQHGPADGFFSYSIVATQPNTTVLIHQKINQSSSATTTVNLTNVGDVYQFLGTDDYTGTYVEVDPATSACKTFAMFSGSSGISIPFATNASLNPLFQQLYSVNNWGKSYAYVPFSGPDQGNIIRILAQEDNTIVNIDGFSTPIHLNKGAVYTSTPIPTSRMITANKPISVAQFSLSERNADSRNISLGPDYNGQFPVYSDPTMVILSPVEFSTKDLTVYSTTLTGIVTRFINVVIKTSASATFRVNGAVPTGATFTPIGTSGYSFMSLNVGVSPYAGGALASIRLTANEGFNAVVYGFADFDAYAYSAGTNLSTDLFLTTTDHASHQELSTGCKDQPLDFKLTLPYITTELQWTLDPTITAITQISPTYTSFVNNGDTFYEYRLLGNSFTTSGNKEIKINAKLPTITAGCNNEYADLVFDFQIYNTPEAKFNAVSQSCLNEPITFNDASNSSDSNITQWAWDFGDGSITSTRSPRHTYTTSGTYTVTLNVTSTSGCTSSASQTVQILALPVASFSNGVAVCQNGSISFTDTSTSADEAITQWDWHFGDGQTSSLQNPIHTFSKAGSFAVSLTVKTGNGCASAIFVRNVVIHPLPQVNFESPKICWLDTIASFTNTTTIADGTDSGLTYLWNFGDPNASVTNTLTSTLKNPTHRFSTKGSYTITLTTTSINNCSVTLIKQFLVNGDSPQADFKVFNEKGLCSSEPVIFTDKASVDFGEIVRLEWYYDLDNDPTNTFEDDNPNLRERSPKQYSHQYPVFHTPLTRSYTIKMVAYSGRSCVNEISRTIVLKAVPDVVFDAISNTCLDKSPFMLSAHEISSFVGSGQFSGPGVSADGMFNPSAAGAGNHILSYTFTGSNGCPIVKTQAIEVYPLPTANAGEDRVLLRGESIQLEGSAHGNHLSYKWAPSTGLNRDDILNPIASPAENTTYHLLVTSENGCTSESQVFVKILQLLNMQNIFTPNGDGINDTWIIKNLDMYPGAIVDIFNRYGARIFHSVGDYTPWDGKMNGEDISIGTYYYFIDPKNRRNSISGSVTILR